MFGVHLLALLSEKYPTPQVYGLCSSVLLHYLRAEPLAPHLAVLRSSLSQFVRIARVFPPLSGDVLDLLMRIRSALHATTVSPSSHAHAHDADTGLRDVDEAARQLLVT